MFFHVSIDLCYISVQFRAPPDITLAPENRTAYEGSDVELICRYISGLEAITMWHKLYMINGSYDDKNSKPLQVCL